MEKINSTEYLDVELRVDMLKPHEKLVIGSWILNSADLATLNTDKWINDAVIHA